MKINKILVKIIIATLLIILCNSCMCYAAGGKLPSLGLFQPELSVGSRTTNIISSILSVLLGVGIITIVVSIALIGFGMILGSASEKAADQEKFVGIFIAALVLTGGSIIAKLIISVAESI